jgi:outer membrane protein
MFRGRTRFLAAAGGALALALRATPAQTQTPTSPATPLQPAVVVTLDEAVRRALAASPAVVRGVGEVRVARSGERVAGGAYLPSLALESNTMRATTPSPVGQPGAVGGVADRTTAVGLSSTLDVFTAGRRGAERRQARAETTEREATLVARRYGVVLRTKRGFFDVLRTGDLLRVAQARVARAEEGLSAARLRHNLGTATGSDELRARLELTRAKQDVLQAEATRRAALFALGRMVGVDGAVGAAGWNADSIRPRPLPLADDALVAEIEGQAPAVRAATASLDAAGAGIAAARSRYAPSVQLTGGYRWLAQPSLGANTPSTDPGGTRALASDSPIWGLRLGVAYPIFDGFRREDAVQRADAERDASAAELADARRAARADAERVLAALHVAEERIALAEEAVMVAREDLRVITARYRAGASTILERITSQVNLATAETELVSVRHDYQIARAELEALAGREL